MLLQLRIHIFPPIEKSPEAFGFRTFLCCLLSILLVRSQKRDQSMPILPAEIMGAGAQIVADASAAERDLRFKRPLIIHESRRLVGCVGITGCNAGQQFGKGIRPGILDGRVDAHIPGRDTSHQIMLVKGHFMLPVNVLAVVFAEPVGKALADLRYRFADLLPGDGSAAAAGIVGMYMGKTGIRGGRQQGCFSQAGVAAGNRSTIAHVSCSTTTSSKSLCQMKNTVSCLTRKHTSRHS